MECFLSNNVPFGSENSDFYKEVTALFLPKQGG
jgi:hypothetical protein